ncbi:MAG: hypothetical protein LBD15_01120 [Holosporales bacterium]|nr:hypothetical protein [Holosporales bacterium]
MPPNSSYYTIHIFLDPEDTFSFATQGFGVGSGRTFSGTVEAALGVPGLAGKVPPEVSNFLLHTIGDMPQQP